MFKFFRRIRQQLLAKNRISKYLLYAVGEIVLVVIGILIALQINNWNEFRKDRALEELMLKDLRQSLISDREEIDEMIDQLSTDLDNIRDINQFIAQSATYADSMDVKFKTLMYSKSFLYELTAYKALENEGIKIIRNPSIKSAILQLYNMDYPNVQHSIDNFLVNLVEFYRPNMRDLFDFIETEAGTVYRPRDYAVLRSNTNFMNNLVTCNINCKNIKRTLEYVRQNNSDLIELIERELEN